VAAVQVCPAMRDLNWCVPILRRLLIPFYRFATRSATLASGVPVSCCRGMKCFGGRMAKIIEFYIPQSFRKVSKWLPPAERGKMLAFPLAEQKSA